MLDYNTSPDKPNKNLINYLGVRGGEVKAIYEYIEQQGTLSRDAVSKRFGKKEAGEYKDRHVSRVLKFLHGTDFIYERTATTVEPYDSDSLGDASFEARLLHHLRMQPGEQDHFGRIYDAALNTGKRTISDDNLLEELERELEYDFTWNEEKVSVWADLVPSLGLVSHSSREGVVLSPSRALMFELLSLHERHGESDDFLDAISWIEDHFFDCLESRAGTPTIYRPIADVLWNLENDGCLEMRAMADAQNEVTLPSGNNHSQKRTIKSYSLSEAPEMPAYQYPLEQTVISA
jgi:hypothetical protein